MEAALRVQLGRLAVALMVVLAVAPSAAAAASLVLEERGNGQVVVPDIGDAELSGVTWMDAGRFLSVDDGGSRLFPLDVTLDDATGAIAKVVAGAPVVLAGAKDPEGIARRPGHEGVLVVDEGTRDLREYDPASGKLLHAVAP